MTPESELVPVRRQAIDAVRVMFDRAVQHYPTALEITDNKEDVEDTTLVASGPLQDCEFGMILLLMREWLGDSFVDDSEDFATKFEWVIKSLVESTSARLLKPNLKNEGGGGGRTAFFTGEPYTQHSRGKKYSANLDAAMIAVSFLALAVKQLDQSLSEVSRSQQLKDVTLPDWVQNLRDVSLHIIIEGLKYATDCRVFSGDKFLGFTSDPESNRESPANGSLNEDADRLFFTWTACETINDMIGWRKDYLTPYSTALPAPVVTELNVLISDLQTALSQAADWCAEVFLARFKDLQPPDPTDLVTQITEIGLDGVPNDDQQQSINQLKPIVQNVYHMSQYAAIRSLVPEKVSLEEVKKISDTLDILVKQTIIASKLDDARHPKLFTTLTREYGLGTSNPDPYVDDAWYPLVMRSLSGLLARTLAEMGTNFSRREVSDVIVSFRRSLQEHFRNMIKRRPVGGPGGSDGKLWSFVTGQPYVLYATQRTIFALIKYEEFLVAVDEFERAEPDDIEKREAEFSMIFANQFMEFFRPAIKKLLLQIPSDPVDGAQGTANTTTVDGELPSEPWAAETIRHWLESLTEDFTKTQVANNIQQQVKSLILVKKHVDRFQMPSPEEFKVLDQKEKNALNKWAELVDAFNSIKEFRKVGPKISQSSWEDDELKQILFEYLFGDYLTRSAKSFDALLNKKSLPELWKLIDEAQNKLDSIKATDKTARAL